MTSISTFSLTTASPRSYEESRRRRQRSEGDLYEALGGEENAFFNLFGNGVQSLGMDRVSVLIQPEGGESLEGSPKVQANLYEGVSSGWGYPCVVAIAGAFCLKSETILVSDPREGRW